MNSTASGYPNTYREEKNKVTDENFRTSRNFYLSDKIFRNYLGSTISKGGIVYMKDKLDMLGKESAGRMNELSLLADKFGPELVKRNYLGETINQIRFHPAYSELLNIAVKSEMFRVKWEPSLRKKFGSEKQRLGFAAGYIYAMSECGIYCPLCMTDGVARLIDIFCSAEDKKRLLPHIYTANAGEFFTGAMYLTEKTGGSDVGANIAVGSPSPTLPEGKGVNAGYQTARNSSYHLLKQLQEERKKQTTETEQILWNYLKGKKLEGYKFRRQHIIDEFIVDFVCLSKKLIVEIDGKYHEKHEMIEADKLRTEILQSLGYKVTRFKNEEVIGDIDSVLVKIKEECNKRADSPLPLGGAGGGLFLLYGEKWFCSNANADLIFALARTDEKVHGTKGLSIFLIEKYLPSGERNPIDIIRLKEKLGVRSMATAECMLSGTLGKLTGKEFEGFKVMVEMINLSRLYNSVAALACSRRALIEAYQFLSHRNTFGKTAMEHALIRSKLTELGALNVANFYLVWRVIKALDLMENGDEREASIFRIINPMTKKWSAETGVYITRESMELMGGIGYIEDGVIPKLMRDVMVLPIWEGSGNIIILDMLRAMAKSDGLNVLFDEINATARKNSGHEKFLKTELNKLFVFAGKLKSFSQGKKETSAKFFFEKLTALYQISLLIENLNEESRQWILPSIDFLMEKYSPSGLKERDALTADAVRKLMAWEF